MSYRIEKKVNINENLSVVVQFPIKIIIKKKYCLTQQLFFFSLQIFSRKKEMNVSLAVC